jgi:hypothetical protein
VRCGNDISPGCQGQAQTQQTDPARPRVRTYAGPHRFSPKLAALIARRVSAEHVERGQDDI